MNFLERQAFAAWVVMRNLRNVVRFRLRLGYWPHVLFPRTYNEKMLWRKLFDRNPKIAELSDKLKAKTYFKQTCPDLKVVEPLWVGKRPEDIPDALLDQDVIIKTNHGSAFNIVMRQTKLDRADINKTVNAWLAKPYAANKLEWGYGQIDRKVYVEPMLRPADGDIPMDFNFEVCGDNITSCFVMGDKVGGHAKIGIFGADGHRLATTVASVPDPKDQLPQDTIMPPAFAVAAKFARTLGRNFDNARVDFMCVGDHIFGCEMTFYSKSGYGNVFSDHKQREILADAWDLRRSWFLKTPQSGWRGRYAMALNAHLNSKPMPVLQQAQS